MDGVVLTGGGWDYTAAGQVPTLTTVTRYTMQGQATHLPSLNTGRGWHACGKVTNEDGAVVSLLSHLLLSLQFIFRLILLLVGSTMGAAKSYWTLRKS